MEQMEDKLNTILGNPEMMRQIMAMAQSLGAGSAPPGPPAEIPRRETPPVQEPDMASLQKLMAFAQQTNIDHNQQNLLKALNPFLPQDRIRKLERAMRAAKLAGLAGSALGQFQSGR